MRILAGIWAGESLRSPGGRVRPTHEVVRDAWLAEIEAHLPEARILDLFAGSGSLGLESLSRGAASVDFVENGGAALHALKANVAQRKLRPAPRGKRPTSKYKAARVFKRDAIPFCAQLSSYSYDITFADPPYNSRKLDRIIEQWQRIPFSRILGVEHSPSHSVPKGKARIEFDASVVTLYYAAEASS